MGESLNVLCVGELQINEIQIDNIKNILGNVYEKNIANIICNYLEKQFVTIIKIFDIQRNYDFHSVFGSIRSYKYTEYKNYKEPDIEDYDNFIFYKLDDAKYNTSILRDEKYISNIKYKEKKDNIVIISDTPFRFNRSIRNENYKNLDNKRIIRETMENLNTQMYRLREHDYEKINISDDYWKNIEIPQDFINALEYLKNSNLKNRKIITYFS